MMREKIFDQVITAYRRLIEQRYEYDQLKKNTDLPASFDEEKVRRFRDYFLNSIYPNPVKRRELNEAFEQLEDYTRQPKKLLSLLMESARVVFKYGTSLPKILSAGLSALRSYQAATKFEKSLVDKAIEMGMTAEIDDDQMKQLLNALDYEEIQSFMTQTESLFSTLHDRELVKKIKSIVSTLIANMKKKPTIFSANEIHGLELGKDIVIEGDKLFEELSAEDQKRIFSFIIENERQFFNSLKSTI